ncbi:MAG: hypothetical protein RJB39_471 [Candidatus Parcubacteria bacterium]|jgi:hypothetical protein
MEGLDNRLQIVYNILIMLKIFKNTKTVVAILVIFMIPVFASAGTSGDYDEGYYSPYEYSGWNDSAGDYSGSYGYTGYDDSYDYTPYSYDTGYYNDNYGYDTGYSNYGNYGGYDYPSYNNYGGTYGGDIYGGYRYPTVGGSTPAVTTPAYTTNTNVSSSNSNAVANAVNTNNNVNNNTNVNNVYVYTNPSGTAVINNPAHQRLDGYCVITPSNPRIGQSVTATAYASGGIGSYTYQWSGDLSSGWGASTSFTSYNVGTKNINVTIRSGEEVMTKSCSVTFVQDTISNDFSAVCYPSIQNATVGQTITWRATVNGNSYSGYTSSYDYPGYGYNNNNYVYTWTGSDGLYGSGSAVSKTYAYAGLKTASVTVSNGSRTITANCSANVTQAYSYVQPSSGTPVSGVYVQPEQIRVTSGTPVSGVYLNDLPATGISLNWKHYMIAFMVLILAVVTFSMSQSRKKLFATQE